MGISYFKIRNQPKIKKNGKQFKHFFPFLLIELHSLLWKLARNGLFFILMG